MNDVEVYRDGKKAESLSTLFLKLATRKGETLVLVPLGSSLK
jgi:hypothetical protein